MDKAVRILATPKYIILGEGMEELLVYTKQDIDVVKELLKATCDTCKYRVYHYRDAYNRVDIHRCLLREQLLFNGGCGGLCCNMYEQGVQKCFER